MRRTAYRNSRPTSYDRVRTRAGQLVEEAIDQLGSFSPVLAITRLVERRCLAEGVDPPTGHVVRARIAYRRRLAAEGERERARLVLDHCPIDLPVTFRNADGRADPVLPFASFALIEPGAWVVAAGLKVGLPDASDTHRLLTDAVARLDGGDVAPVVATARCPGDWNLIEGFLPPLRGRPRRSGAAMGSEARRLLGRTLSGVELRPRSTARAMSEAGSSADQESLAGAGRILRSAVAAHNSRLVAPAGLSLVSDALRTAFIEALATAQD